MVDTRDNEILDALGGRVLARLVIECATALRRLSSSENRMKFGLNNSDWSIIALVGGAREIGFKDLREMIALDPGQLSRGVSRLHDCGLILRENLKTFPREQRLRLSAEGRELFSRMRTSALERNRHLTEEISADDLRAVARVLTAVTARARNELRCTSAESPTVGPSRDSRRTKGK